jgi:NAD(P)H-quinone oxidoreductase subunit 5
MVLGSLTAIGASLVSIAQIDIKRTLSHSTSAYLGLVFLAVGTQQDDLALMFLFAHGVAKALLFMSVGSIILTTSTQDLTEMGGLAKRMPATTFAYVVGGLASVALLPLGGFWAMVQWMEGVWAVSPWLVAVLLLVNGLTAFNLVRVFGLVFWGHPQPKTRRAPEVPWLMAVPMVTLSIFALLLPLLLKQWQLLPALNEINLSLLASLLASGIGGAALAGVIYLNPAVRKPTPLVGSVLRDVLAYDFFIDRLYKLSVVFGVVQGSRLTAWFDRYVVDGLVNFVGVASIFSGESLKYTISGQSRSYLLNLFVGLLLALSLTGWLIWSPLF